MVGEREFSREIEITRIPTGGQRFAITAEPGERAALAARLGVERIDRLVAEETGLPVHIAEDPLSAVAEGTGRVLQHLEFLKRVTHSG